MSNSNPSVSSSDPNPLSSLTSSSLLIISGSQISMKSVVMLGRFLVAIFSKQDATLTINGSSITFYSNGDLSISSCNSIFIFPQEYLIMNSPDSVETHRHNLPEGLFYRRYRLREVESISYSDSRSTANNSITQEIHTDCS